MGHPVDCLACAIPLRGLSGAGLQASRQTSENISDVSASELGLESSQASACSQFPTLDSLKHGESPGKRMSESLPVARGTRDTRSSKDSSANFGSAHASCSCALKENLGGLDEAEGWPAGF